MTADGFKESDPAFKGKRLVRDFTNSYYNLYYKDSFRLHLSLVQGDARGTSLLGQAFTNGIYNIYTVNNSQTTYDIKNRSVPFLTTSYLNPFIQGQQQYIERLSLNEIPYFGLYDIKVFDFAKLGLGYMNHHFDGKEQTRTPDTKTITNRHSITDPYVENYKYVENKNWFFPQLSIDLNNFGLRGFEVGISPYSALMFHELDYSYQHSVGMTNQVNWENQFNYALGAYFSGSLLGVKFSLEGRISRHGLDYNGYSDLTAISADFKNVSGSGSEPNYLSINSVGELDFTNQGRNQCDFVWR